MNRAVSGVLKVHESDRPLGGLLVVAARVTPRGPEVLGYTVSGDYGRFRIDYQRLEGPADIALFVFSPDWHLLYTEPVHRQIEGAELQLQLAIPRRKICGL